eukprot:m.1080474 g.1080474  ORF g.1080474 m.1080474 type:complete len:53 (+) comp24256_c0_seq2:3252-3410(+)
MGSALPHDTCGFPAESLQPCRLIDLAFVFLLALLATPPPTIASGGLLRCMVS